MEIKPGYKQTEVGVIPEDWDSIPMREVVTSISSGKSSSKRHDNGSYPIYGSTGIIGHCIDPDYEGKRVLVARVGANAGAVYYVDGKYCVSDNTLMIQAGKQIEIDYIYSFLRYFNLNKLVFGSGQPLITGTQLKVLRVPVPTLPEQQTIASALSDIDSLISSLTKLIEKKKNIKQGAMQELLTGKRRLEGFSGGWVRGRLGDVGKCIRGVSYNGNKDLYLSDNDNSIRLLRSNNIQESVINYKDIQFVDRRRVKDLQIMESKNILICMANGSKELVGKAALYMPRDNHKYTFGAFMGCFRILCSNYDKRFVFYNFQSNAYKRFIEILLSGSSINNLKPSDIESIVFNWPNKSEQTAIANILSDMDSEIEALEQKLNKYNNIKQGMMQELLTGRIRLVEEAVS